MSLNVVTVTIQIDQAPGDPIFPEGTFIFSPSGLMWPDLSSNPIVPVLIHGFLSTAGYASASLVASDNFTTGVLNWDVILNVQGLPTINFANMAVNFATGATQNLFTILQTSGWIPQAKP